MAYDVGSARAFGSQRVLMRTQHGTFAGRFVSRSLRERAILVLFETADPAEIIAVDLESIVDVSFAAEEG